MQAEKIKYVILQRQEEEAKKQRIAEDLIRKQEEYRRQEEMKKNEAMRQQSMLEETERQRRKYGIERQQVENLQQREGYERMDTGEDMHTTLEERLNSICQTVKTYAEENFHLIGDLESRRTIHYCNTSLQMLKVNKDEC